MSARIPIVSSDCHIGLALPAAVEQMLAARAMQRTTVRKYALP
jgi:hypothetical protein